MFRVLCLSTSHVANRVAVVRLLHNVWWTGTGSNGFSGGVMCPRVRLTERPADRPRNVSGRGDDRSLAADGTGCRQIGPQPSGPGWANKNPATSSVAGSLCTSWERQIPKHSHDSHCLILACPAGSFNPEAGFLPNSGDFCSFLPKSRSGRLLRTGETLRPPYPRLVSERMRWITKSAQRYGR